MTGKAGRRTALMALAAGLMGTAACAPLGAMGGGTGGSVMLGSGTGVLGVSSRTAMVDGEVRSVDTRRSRVLVRDQWGRAHYIHYDRQTLVVYRQRGYPVSALERGDIVRVQVARGRSGTLVANRIDVRENMRDRGRIAVRTERLTGAVSSVDARRGSFTIQVDRNRSLIIQLPPRLSRDDARRFERLRRGDRVRVEIVPVGRGAAELVRFR